MNFTVQVPLDPMAGPVLYWSIVFVWVATILTVAGLGYLFWKYRGSAPC